MTPTAKPRVETIWNNEQWTVTPDGMRATLPDGRILYTIPAEDLAELRYPEKGIAKWPLQVAEKTWADFPAFMEAWRKALDIHQPDGVGRINLAATEEAAAELVPHPPVYPPLDYLPSVRKGGRGQ